MRVRRIDVSQRRARLARRHGLTASGRVSDPATVADLVVALHATDPASVYLSAIARMRTPSIGAVEGALYDEHTLVRMLGMRRTMFVVGRETVPVVQASSSRGVAAVQRRRLLTFMAQTDPARDPKEWLARSEMAALEVLATHGEVTAAQLGAFDPRLGERLVLGAGTSSVASASVASRVLLLLGADGRVVRGRPGGSWTSSQYRWSLAENWLPGGIPDQPTETAQVALVRRWLTAFGPGTAEDLKWWTGWTAREVKRALGAIETADVDLDGVPGLVLRGDRQPAEPLAEPWAALLPALDPTVMGWAGPARAWYLGEHGPALFDRNGNAGPTVWWDGRIVGGWAQRADGEIVFRLLEDVGAEGVGAVEAQVQRVAAAIGDVVVIPRFRTPLERELVA